MKKHLDQSEVWAIAGGALHDEEYRTNYTKALDFVLKDRNLKILDTAGGTGFPTFDLYKLGYKNLSVTDGNETYAKELQENLKKAGMDIPAHHSSWQELGSKITEKFDAVINTDNSFVYMDGWMGKETPQGFDNITPRIQLCLKNFLEVVKEGGLVVIGLGKHYVPTYTGTNKTFESDRNGERFHTTWKAEYDWSKDKRLLTWSTKVESDLSEGEFIKNAYLITKEELAEQMKIAGFKNVYILVPNDTRDDFVIGFK